MLPRSALGALTSDFFGITKQRSIQLDPITVLQHAIRRTGMTENTAVERT